MQGDPTTTIETEDGRLVVTHCFFDIPANGGKTWEEFKAEFEALGCEVEPVNHMVNGLPRLNFRVTLPLTAVRGTGTRFDNTILDLFFVGSSYLYILRPNHTRSCRTLAIGTIAEIKVGKGQFWKKLRRELGALLLVRTAA